VTCKKLSLSLEIGQLISSNNAFMQLTPGDENDGD
jgi:hypothetical protein